jgi:hypothetical protein
MDACMHFIVQVVAFQILNYLTMQRSAFQPWTFRVSVPRDASATYPQTRLRGLKASAQFQDHRKIQVAYRHPPIPLISSAIPFDPKLHETPAQVYDRRPSTSAMLFSLALEWVGILSRRHHILRRPLIHLAILLPCIPPLPLEQIDKAAFPRCQFPYSATNGSLFGSRLVVLTVARWREIQAVAEHLVLLPVLVFEFLCED